MTAADAAKRATILASVIETFRPHLSQWAIKQVQIAVADINTADLEAAAAQIITKGIDRRDGRSVPGLLRGALDDIRAERARSTSTLKPLARELTDEEHARSLAVMRRLRAGRHW